MRWHLLLQTLQRRVVFGAIRTALRTQRNELDPICRAPVLINSTAKGSLAKSCKQILNQRANMSVKFGSRWGDKSYKVHYAGNYSNGRESHVETPTPGLTGKTFQLGVRSEKKVGKNTAVMYNVVGVKNGAYEAHFTVYFGPGQNAKNF